MDIQLINDQLLADLHEKAKQNERKRQCYDLRTTPEDTSQRMLNVLEPGTKVPIHRHQKTTESAICIEGRLDWIIYEELADGSQEECHCVVEDGMCFKEIARYALCPREHRYGIQIPLGAWHSIEVYERSTIFEAKDGCYEPIK